MNANPIADILGQLVVLEYGKPNKIKATKKEWSAEEHRYSIDIEFTILQTGEKISIVLEDKEAEAIRVKAMDIIRKI